MKYLTVLLKKLNSTFAIMLIQLNLVFFSLIVVLYYALPLLNFKAPYFQDYYGAQALLPYNRPVALSQTP